MERFDVTEIRKSRILRTEGKLRRVISAILMVIVIPAIMAIGLFVWDDRQYFLVSILILICSMLPFFMRFERRKPKTRELVVIAVMVTIAVVGRAAFYMVPQFKPVAAIVIITGVAFGAEAGFITGALSAFTSNLLFGQGPWTPWQMFAFGMIGFIAGLLFKNEIKTKLSLLCLCIYGALSTFVIYGALLDTASVFMTASKVTFEMLLATYISGITFNLIHAAATIFFLVILARPMLKKLCRIKIKYGIIAKDDK
ncbi:MAG: ECF transporter S component [Clostridia bacterium]|nr:ECF transporter S component [Clostridia bacterium]